MIFKRISSGLQMIRGSLFVFKRYPLLIAPLFFSWIIYLPTLIILFLMERTADSYIIGAVLVFFVFPFLLILSSSLMLEFIQQIERGRRLSVGQAMKETFSKNIFKIIPLALIWIFLSIIATIIISFIPSRSARRRAQQLVSKALRMIVFLIMPAIAWEDLGFIQSFKRGMSILRTHPVEFATGYAGTYIAGIIILLPLTITWLIIDYFNLTIAPWGWALIIIYAVLAWSYITYLEQMFVATLFLWHKKWEKAVRTAQRNRQVIPSLQQVTQPSLLDNVPDLIEEQTTY